MFLFVNGFPETKLYPDKPEKLAQCISIYGTILGQCTHNRAKAGPIFLDCRDRFFIISRLAFISDFLFMSQLSRNLIVRVML